LKENLGIHDRSDLNFSLTAKEWANGKTFFYFNLALGPTDPDDVRVDAEAGDCYMNLTFRKPTPKAYKLLVIGFKYQTIQIDKFNNCLKS
jgi:hypothetical protein